MKRKRERDIYRPVFYCISGFIKSDNLLIFIKMNIEQYVCVAS